MIGTLFVALLSMISIVFWIVILLLIFTAIGAGLIAIFGKDKKK
jgi:NADH:ubiquinone oxidoreductase subunit 5 (subunit L)/multisubunit Na+/H+ antiporter MnhA subunit